MKLSLNFLDRWENRLFKSYNASHVPVSKFVTITVLVSAFAIVIIVAVIMDWFASAKSVTQEIVTNCILGASFLVTLWKAHRPFMAFSTVGSKIGYAVYILLLFGITTVICIQIAMFVVMLVLGLLVLTLLLYFCFGSKETKGKVHYYDGTSEELIKEGRGITGETFYRGKDSGNHFVD